jgi:hypothetical protein
MSSFLTADELSILDELRSAYPSMEWRCGYPNNYDFLVWYAVFTRNRLRLSVTAWRHRSHWRSSVTLNGKSVLVTAPGATSIESVTHAMQRTEQLSKALTKLAGAFQ